MFIYNSPSAHLHILTSGRLLKSGRILRKRPISPSFEWLFTRMDPKDPTPYIEPYQAGVDNVFVPRHSMHLTQMFFSFVSIENEIVQIFPA